MDAPASPRPTLAHEGLQLAQKAVEADCQQHFGEAISLYGAAASKLEQAIASQLVKNEGDRALILARAQEYRQRMGALQAMVDRPGNVQMANVLRKNFSLTDIFDGDGSDSSDLELCGLDISSSSPGLPPRAPSTKGGRLDDQAPSLSQPRYPLTPLEEAEQLLRQAQDDESHGRWADSKASYAAAAERFISCMRDMHESEKKALSEKVVTILDRIEHINSLRTAPAPSPNSSRAVIPAAGLSARTLSTEKKVERYSDSELDVLRRSSTINGRIFLPWLDSDETSEVFNFSRPYTDDTVLPLSSKQQKRFFSWMRPSQFYHGTPSMIKQVSALSITQDLVTDCSFVASLCITAAYEQKWKKRLITNIIYPQNAQGEPLYNPSGKYMVKLWINGIARKVIVDDLLPVDKDLKLLCSYSAVSGELWVSIIEKAYMKVHGGYDFPGSNSGIDLFSLTGWIPESLQFEPGSTEEKEYERTWARLVSASKYGDCLITISTGEMEREEAHRLGLVESHAYAVLDVREACGVRLLQVKNPWSRVRWRGPYSASDYSNWTPKLLQELQYDPQLALTNDNGIFWIDFESVKRYFRGLFMNWNPELFPFRTVIHRHWPVTIGPENDAYTVAYNPQYTLTVNAEEIKKNSAVKPEEKGDAAEVGGSVWALLTRHTCSKEQVVEQDFLTLHVYKGREGKRVIYPQDALLRGVYSNNPHVLMRIDPPPGVSCYSLVVSQYEKLRPIDYTLDIFSTCPFTMKETEEGLPFKTSLGGAWDQKTAGGNPRFPSFLHNPQWLLTLEQETALLVFLDGPLQFPINVRVVRSSGRVASVALSGEETSSGDYRSGFCYLEKDTLAPGVYCIIPSTFEKGSCGDFKLTVCTSKPHQLRPVPPEGEGMIEQTVKGAWSHAEGTAAGCNNHGKYRRNPKYLLEVISKCALFVRLRWLSGKPYPAMNISLYQTSAGCSLSPSTNPNAAYAGCTSNQGVYVNTVSGVVTPTVSLEPGLYCLLPSTFNPEEGELEMLIYSSCPVSVRKVN